MDLGDIEDLYASDQEPMQRLQVNEVVARVKRHCLHSSAKSKQINDLSVQQADNRSGRHETLSQALNGAFDSILKDEDDEGDEEDEEEEDDTPLKENGAKEDFSRPEEEKIAKQNRVNKKLFRAQHKAYKKKSDCASTTCSCKKDPAGCHLKKGSSSMRQESLNSVLPGCARIYVKTWGCV